MTPAHDIEALYLAQLVRILGEMDLNPAIRREALERAAAVRYEGDPHAYIAAANAAYLPVLHAAIDATQAEREQRRRDDALRELPCSIVVH